MRSTHCLVHGTVTCVLYPGVWLCLATGVGDLLMLSMGGDRAEADDAAVEGLVELKVILLLSLHVHPSRSGRSEASYVCTPCTCCQRLSMGLTSVK